MVNLGWLSEWQGQVGDIRSRGIRTLPRSLFISAVAPLTLRLSLDLHVTTLRPPPPRRIIVDMTAPPTNRILEQRDVCGDVCTPRRALIFFFQIKACKERWDAPRTGAAARWRCAAAQDQTKMKITHFGLVFMRWVQWPSKIQFYWHPGSATAVCSGIRRA